MAMSVHVLCVRHGLSTWNLQRRWQGQADPPLSDEGRAGAVTLADALVETFGDRRASVSSSDLQRAADTAAILAVRLGAGPVVIDGRLREADIGPWQGLTAAEIEARWPGYLAAGQRPPGFEPEAGLVERVVAALGDVAAAADGRLPIVVSHAGVLRALRRHCGALDDHLPNLAGMWFSVSPGAVGFGGLFQTGHGPGPADPQPL
jgi:broad specificity phosphatase PhoE